MPSPTPYNRTYSFTDFQANNPSAPLPGPQVDNELENVELSLNGTIDALKDIRRSDGRLANGSVGPDQLSSALNFGFDLRGGWELGQQYLAGDGVTFDQRFYSARIANTGTNANRPDVDTDTWRFLFSVADVVIPDNSLAGTKLLPETITGRELANGSIDYEKFKSAMVRPVVSRAVAKTLNVATVTAIAITGEGSRNGVFLWTPGDQSARVAQDPAETTVFAADSYPTSQGAWVRVTATSDFLVGWAGEAADTAIPAAIAAVGQNSSRRKVDLGGQTLTVSSVPANQFGAPLKNGALLVPSNIAGKARQYNTYADDVNGLMIARENLALWMIIGPAAFNTIYLYGDSTVQGGISWSRRPHELFRRALLEAGLNNCNVVNRGVGGTSWSDLNVIPDLGAGTKLIVIKYGINDSAKTDPLTTFMTDARAKLAQIRAQPSGSFGNLSILLLGPNASYHPSGTEKAEWFEKLRPCYIQLCKEFDCAYFDMYAFLQDTKNAPGVWMDNFVVLDPPQPGEGIHPEETASGWYFYEGIKRFVLGDGCWNPDKSNHYWNTTADTLTPAASKVPAAYPFGTHLELASTLFGFPLDGQLETVRQADGRTVQTISSLDPIPRTARRHGADLTWTQWAGVPIALTAFSGAWVAKGGGYAAPGYQIGADGFVDLFGVLSSGASGAVMTLPVAIHPAATHTFKQASSGIVTVFSNGTVTAGNDDASLLSLDGIRYRVKNSF